MSIPVQHGFSPCGTNLAQSESGVTKCTFIALEALRRTTWPLGMPILVHCSGVLHLFVGSEYVSPRVQPLYKGVVLARVQQTWTQNSLESVEHQFIIITSGCMLRQVV